MSIKQNYEKHFFFCVFMVLSIKYLTILNIYIHKQVVTSVKSLVKHTTISIDANRPRSTTVDDDRCKSTDLALTLQTKLLRFLLHFPFLARHFFCLNVISIFGYIFTAILLHPWHNYI